MSQTPIQPDAPPPASAATTPEIQLGGQALVEGVMMRSPHFVGAAVRRASGEIETRVERFEPITRRVPWTGLPLIRGVIGLFEMLLLGSRYLNWSSDLAMQDAPESDKPKSGKAVPLWAFALTLLVSLSFGFLLFVATPNILADIGLRRHTDNRFILNIGEGGIKLCIFVVYLWLIGRMKNIKRLFEYHGAEHKVVFAVENKRPITPEGARDFDTPHPRCGTGFALLTVMVSILCFSWLPWTQSHLPRILMRALMMPLVAGLSYEILKASSNPRWNHVAIWILTPGMWLQRLTTRQPDDAQLEVSCRAMQIVMDAEARGHCLPEETPENATV